MKEKVTPSGTLRALPSEGPLMTTSTSPKVSLHDCNHGYKSIWNLCSGYTNLSFLQTR